MAQARVFSLSHDDQESHGYGERSAARMEAHGCCEKMPVNEAICLASVYKTSCLPLSSSSDIHPFSSTLNLQTETRHLKD